ncbi:hypothetical protein EG240_13900 [Paenimyroides tangerinum]|uniref:TonB C-terminal domain-containing protein n=1 Tax=Paenimyroides tangerinum TaxID=2488728 RepID=A0A3P3W2L8_9FLAO|nr:energy transducer TonB [Paenimyroides tangerinum]RRJ88156.1 hypothetical protein EG240_13900 [Paenimyroides tangerinum]
MSNIYSYKNTILILIFLLTNSLFAQNDSLNQVKAQPPFETIEYVSQIISNLNLPEEKVANLPNENITFNLSFFVSNEGKVNNVRIKNDNYELNSYFENAMKSLPNWIPAKINGENKSSREQLVISVKLKADEETKALPEIGLRKFNQELISKIFKDVESLDGQDLIFRVTFIVEEDGSLTNIKIVESNSPLYHSEIVRVIKSMPKWNPARENGIPVRSTFSMPVRIIFEK